MNDRVMYNALCLLKQYIIRDKDGQLSRDLPFEKSGICLNIRHIIVRTMGRTAGWDAQDRLVDTFLAWGLDGVYPVYALGDAVAGGTYTEEVETNTIWDNPDRIRLLDRLITYYREKVSSDA